MRTIYLISFQGRLNLKYAIDDEALRELSTEWYWGTIVKGIPSRTLNILILMSTMQVEIYDKGLGQTIYFNIHKFKETE